MRRTLGKGLSQLIAEQFEGGTQEVPIDALDANQRQPRTQFGDERLQELASSIRQHGILQPLVVRPSSEGRFELIAGERRLRAAKLAGLKTVPVVVRAANNQASLELALIENIQREDIGALECARAYRKLMDEFGLTQDQVAEKVGKGRPTIANTVRLLNLPSKVQKGLENGAISEGHARSLLSFEDPAHQLAVYDQILERGLSVREVEKAAKAVPQRVRKAKESTAGRQDPNWTALEQALSTFLGSPVKLTKGEVGGQIRVDFYSDDDLERILSILGFSL